MHTGRTNYVKRTVSQLQPSLFMMNHMLNNSTFPKVAVRKLTAKEIQKWCKSMEIVKKKRGRPPKIRKVIASQANSECSSSVQAESVKSSSNQTDSGISSSILNWSGNMSIKKQVISTKTEEMFSHPKPNLPEKCNNFALEKEKQLQTNPSENKKRKRGRPPKIKEMIASHPDSGNSFSILHWFENTTLNKPLSETEKNNENPQIMNKQNTTANNKRKELCYDETVCKKQKSLRNGNTTKGFVKQIKSNAKENHPSSNLYGLWDKFFRKKGNEASFVTNEERSKGKLSMVSISSEVINDFANKSNALGKTTLGGVMPVNNEDSTNLLVSLPWNSVIYSMNKKVNDGISHWKCVEDITSLARIVSDMITKLETHEKDLEEEYNTEVKKLRQKYDRKLNLIHGNIEIYKTMCKELHIDSENSSQLVNDDFKLKIQNLLKPLLQTNIGRASQRMENDTMMEEGVSNPTEKENNEEKSSNLTMFHKNVPQAVQNGSLPNDVEDNSKVCLHSINIGPNKENVDDSPKDINQYENNCEFSSTILKRLNSPAFANQNHSLISSIIDPAPLVSEVNDNCISHPVSSLPESVISTITHYPFSSPLLQKNLPHETFSINAENIYNESLKSNQRQPITQAQHSSNMPIIQSNIYDKINLNSYLFIPHLISNSQNQHSDLIYRPIMPSNPEVPSSEPIFRPTVPEPICSPIILRNMQVTSHQYVLNSTPFMMLPSLNQPESTNSSKHLETIPTLPLADSTNKTILQKTSSPISNNTAADAVLSENRLSKKTTAAETIELMDMLATNQNESTPVQYSVNQTSCNLSDATEIDTKLFPIGISEVKRQNLELLPGTTFVTSGKLLPAE